MVTKKRVKLVNVDASFTDALARWLAPTVLRPAVVAAPLPAEPLMAEPRIRRLFVGSAEEPVGVISIDDIARSRERASVRGRQLEARVRETGLLRGHPGHTGQTK